MNRSDFTQSETFTPFPSDEAANSDGIGFNPFVHGASGPMNVSYSSFVYNQTQNFFAALKEVGIPSAFDPNDGSAAGASFLPASLDPVQQVRADARTSYSSTIYSRTNLDVWTGQHVTRVLFEGGAGNSNTTIPVQGASSGQGNASNSECALFGIRNATNVLQPTTCTGPSQYTRRSFASRLLIRFKKWKALRTGKDAGKVTPAREVDLRAIGVEVWSRAERRAHRGNNRLAVCPEFFVSKTEYHSKSRSNRIRWSSSHTTTAQAFRGWSIC